MGDMMYSTSSWLQIREDSLFKLDNIPFGVCTRKEEGCDRGGGGGGEYEVSCVRVGDFVIDLVMLCECDVGCFGKDVYKKVFRRDTKLNAFMGLGRSFWIEVRKEIQALFVADEMQIDGVVPLETLKQDDKLRSQIVLSIDDVQMVLPARIGDYTDFYASKEHASNCGIMLRGKDNALKPNWLHLPVAYHGRSSSIITSGTSVMRPQGQREPSTSSSSPTYESCKALDFELEIGMFIGPASTMGKPINVNEARNHIFGLVLLNDWSARDIQKWEYVPLGPFNGKNFATTISPWIVTLEALEPYKCKAVTQEPEVLPYLKDCNPTMYDIELAVEVNKSTVCRSNLKYLYWTFEQMIAHHTSTGCNLNTGDMFGTGTISGPDEQLGSLIELSWNNTRDVQLSATNETRRYLLDGDAVTLKGTCVDRVTGQPTIGFGRCDGNILPAFTD